MAGSAWQRVVDWLRGFRQEELLLEQAPEDELEEPEPIVLRSQHESWLARLSEEVAEGGRIEVIGSDEFWEHVDGLWNEGHERLASQWITKFVEASMTPPEVVVELRVRLVEMFEKRGDLGPAISHLLALTEESEHAVRAHYLLGEHYRRCGEEVKALRHYEAVLARDVDYPNVKIRVERLRAARGTHGPAAMGETIAGPEAGAGGGARYALIRELGRGATAVVYLARDAELERDVAVKLLHPHLAAAEQAGACARFFAEARVAASLRHPNILAILDLDESARRIVMELAAGGTLRQVLQDHGARPIRWALERHTQILSALCAAHRRGIVHRDVKPANLMFRRDPTASGSEVVLGDFGVAHLPDAEQTAREGGRKGAVGTLAYMAPEQRRGGKADLRWDIYAASVVLFEMLVGAHPWSRRKILTGERSRGDLALPDDVTAGVPAELARGLQEHLESLGDPDAERRPSSEEALHVARELRDHAIAVEGTGSLE